MIQTEKLNIKGQAFIRTWSDSGKMVARDGVLYDEALDPVEFGRTYTESDTDVELTAEEALMELMEVLA